MVVSGCLMLSVFLRSDESLERSQTTDERDGQQQNTLRGSATTHLAAIPSYRLLHEQLVVTWGYEDNKSPISQRGGLY